MAGNLAHIIKIRRRRKLRNYYMKRRKNMQQIDKSRTFKLNYFWITSGGNFSRRAFFFSLFGFIAVIYTVLCISGFVRFNDGLSLYILACNAAFGFNYYKNESEKKGTMNADIPE